MSRILIAVTHLLGAGHLTRAAALARAFAGAGHTVTLVSGGMPVALPRLDGVRLVQLPPLRIVGTAFTTLLDPDGAPVSAERLAARRDGLVAAFKRFGSVTGANVQVRKDGRSRGWGTVQFGSREACEKAVAGLADGKTEIDGRAVEVAIDRKA